MAFFDGRMQSIGFLQVAVNLLWYRSMELNNIVFIPAYSCKFNSP
jgi:hypothetical protein